ncbi:hypothetical protein JXA32_11305, partial [Candidatus Sumerlaeota bacterium]|nr:hypothetical protein [Candidatus Sumerlaeota bacterium]
LSAHFKIEKHHYEFHSGQLGIAGVSHCIGVHIWSIIFTSPPFSDYRGIFSVFEGTQTLVDRACFYRSYPYYDLARRGRLFSVYLHNILTRNVEANSQYYHVAR